MFLLEDLPDEAMMKRFAARFPEMEISSLAACLRLLKVANAVLRELERHFSACGISQARFFALVVLERADEKSLVAAEIARQTGISKKNTARLLDFMEDDGLIKRSAHATDRRASIARITPKGTKVLASSLPGYFAVLNSTVDPLNAAAKNALVDSLDKMLFRIEEKKVGKH